MPTQTERARLSSARYALALVAFLLSGAAGLIYEVCWIRKASLTFGSTIDALSTVLAVFFLGLAIGSWWFGRMTPRLERPLRLFVVLEVGVAVLAALTLVWFPLAESVYGAAYRASGGQGALLGMARFGLVAVLLLPPTILMGGTLPLFCRQFVVERRRIAGSVGFLYGVNTLGATAGCLLAGFVLISSIGVRASILVAALLNLIAAAAVATMRSTRVPAAENAAGGAAGVAGAPAPATRPTGRAAGTRPAVPGAMGPLVAALFFLTGFAVLGHEVLWSRFLALLVVNTVHTYTITLGVVLLGIVIGSVVASHFFDRAATHARILGALQASLGIVIMALMTLPNSFWERIGSTQAIFLLLLGPAILSGASFPLVVRMVVDDPRLAGAGVGRMSAVNTLGGIAGSLAVGFFLLPKLGLEMAARVTTGVSLVIGAVAWLAIDRGSLALRSAAVVVSVALWILLPRLSGTRLPADHLAPPQQLVDYREGLESNLAVVRKSGDVHLEIDTWWQGQAGKTHQIMAAHVPMLLHHDPDRVLLIGVGAGQTPERFLFYDLEQLDCVDIEPAVFDIIRPHFPSAWMDDPRVRLIRADGRDDLAHGEGTYDVISLELGQIFRPGVAAFYTADFYEQVRERLAPEGLVAQFVPLPFLPLEMARSVMRTFVEVFPTSVLWYNTSELLLIGTNDESLTVDPARLALLESNVRVRDDLRFSQWGGAPHWLNQPHAFLGGLLTGPTGLAALTRDGEIYRDDPPRLAYQASQVDRASGSENELAFVQALTSVLESPAEALGFDASSRTAAMSELMQASNLGDLAAAAYLRRFDQVSGVWPTDRLLALAGRALEANPDNAVANRVTGEALMLLDRLDEARPYLSKAVGLNERDDRGQRALGTVFLRLGHVEASIPHYRAAIALRPSANDHHNLALALLAIDDRDGARAELEAALRLDPAHDASRRRLQSMGDG